MTTENKRDEKMTNTPDHTFEGPMPELLPCGCPGTQGQNCFGWCEMLARMECVPTYADLIDERTPEESWQILLDNSYYLGAKAGWNAARDESTTHFDARFGPRKPSIKEYKKAITALFQTEDK